MKGSPFKEAVVEMRPPEGEEDKVYALPVWAHPEGGMFISCWKMSWRERLTALWKGHVWLHIMSQQHPPVAIETTYPFERDSVPVGLGIRRSIIFVLLFVLAAIVGIFFRLKITGVI